MSPCLHPMASYRLQQTLATLSAGRFQLAFIAKLLSYNSKTKHFVHVGVFNNYRYFEVALAPAN